MSFGLLESPRLHLRDIQDDDIPCLRAIAMRDEVARFQPWGPDTPDQVDAYFAMARRAASAQPRSDFILAAVLAASDQVIGYGSLSILEPPSAAELGYFLDPAFWGQGFGTEIAETLVRLAFERLELDEVRATTDPRNLASQRMLDKLGMRRAGYTRNSMLLRDGWRDSIAFALTAQVWRQARPDQSA